MQITMVWKLISSNSCLAKMRELGLGGASDFPEVRYETDARLEPRALAASWLLAHSGFFLLAFQVTCRPLPLPAAPASPR